MKISDNTSVSMPMRNLLSILGATALGVWAYFGVIERLNNIETQGKLMVADVDKNTEFRIGWPRGEMGTLPADAQQDMLIEFMATQLETNIKEAQKELEEKIDKRIKRALENPLGAS